LERRRRLMRYTVGTILKRWTLPILVLCPFLTGCCTQMFGKAIQFAKGQAPGATDVAVILLEPDKTYYPDRLYVKNRAHMVVWIAEADMLTVQFKNPKPAGVDVKCSKDVSNKFQFLCFTTAPFALKEGDQNVFKYTATIQCKGKDPVRIDPEVEIVFP
jgi:hypothetical protein